MKTVKPDRARKVHIYTADSDGTLCGHWGVHGATHGGNMPVPEMDMCKQCLRRSDDYEK